MDITHAFRFTHLICDFAHIQTRFISDGYDALVLLLHQVTDDLVIEVFNVLPCNALPFVLLLFLLKHQLWKTRQRNNIKSTSTQLLC